MGRVGRQRWLEFARNGAGEEPVRKQTHLTGSPSSLQLSIIPFVHVKKPPGLEKEPPERIREQSQKVTSVFPPARVVTFMEYQGEDLRKVLPQ